MALAQDSLPKTDLARMKSITGSMKIPVISTVSGTRSNSEYTDGTAGIYLDYFALPWLKGRRNADLHDTTQGYYWSFRMGYSYSNAPPGDKPKEVNILETETNNKFYLPQDKIVMNPEPAGLAMGKW